MNREIIGMCVQRALSHLEKGELQKARRAFRDAYGFAKVCGCGMDLVNTMRDLGNMELRLGNDDAAEKLFLDAMITRGAPQVMYLSVRDAIANLLARTGDFKGALGMLRDVRMELESIYPPEYEAPSHIKIFEQHLATAIGHLEVIAAGASNDS